MTPGAACRIAKLDGHVATSEVPGPAAAAAAWYGTVTLVRTPDKEGALYVLPVFIPVDVAGELSCDWRPGSVW